MNAAATPAAKTERRFIYGECRNGRNVLFVSGVRIPIAPWWVFALCLTLLPLAMLGLVFWAGGALLLYSARHQRHKPKDALFLHWVGRKLLLVFWLPQRWYFQWRDPQQLARGRRAMALLRPVALRTARRSWRNKVKDSDS